MYSLECVNTEKEALLFVKSHSEVFNLNPSTNAVKEFPSELLSKLHSLMAIRISHDDLDVPSTKRTLITRITKHMLCVEKWLVLEGKSLAVDKQN